MIDNINIKECCQILFQLEQELKIARSIGDAARKCEANYRFFDLKKMRRPVSFLDFDIICGSIKPFVLDRISKNSGIHNDMPLSEILGPHSLQYFLSKLDEYCLPPGSVIEILNTKQKLTNKLTEAGNSFLAFLKTLKDKENPLSYVTEKYPTSKLNEIIDKELNQMKEYLCNLEFLGSALDRSIPIEEFLGDSRPDLSNQFSTVYEYLQKERPLRSVNNFNDALNISALIWFYNCNNIEVKKVPFPILISQTSQLLNLAEIIRNDLIAQQAISFQFINNYHYLFISQSLMYNNRDRFKLIADQASTLAIEIEAVRQSYEKLIEAIQKGEIRYDDYNNEKWQILSLNYSQFNIDWDWLFKSYQKSSLYDNIYYNNLLGSDEVAAMLSNFRFDDNKTINNSIEKTLAIIEQSLKSNHALESILFHTNNIALQNESNLLQQLFHFVPISIMEDFGDYYCDLTPLHSSSANTSFAEFLNKGNRIFVLPRYLSSKGAIFSLELKMMNAGRTQIAISWPHSSNNQNLLNSFSNFICGYDSENHVCTFTFFTNKGEEINRYGNIYDKEITKHLLKNINDSDFLEIKANKFAVFADVQPLDNLELQAGLICDFDESFDIAKTSKLIRATTSFQFLSQPNCYFEKLLSYLLGKNLPNCMEENNL
jgi:hypothetical protein